MQFSLSDSLCLMGHLLLENLKAIIALYMQLSSNLTGNYTSEIYTMVFLFLKAVLDVDFGLVTSECLTTEEYVTEKGH